MIDYLPLLKHGEVQIFDGDEKIKNVGDDWIFKLLETQGCIWGWVGEVLWDWHGD
jgi:hypothetical protein